MVRIDTVEDLIGVFYCLHDDIVYYDKTENIQDSVIEEKEQVTAR